MTSILTGLDTKQLLRAARARVPVDTTPTYTAELESRITGLQGSGALTAEEAMALRAILDRFSKDVSKESAAERIDEPVPTS